MSRRPGTGSGAAAGRNDMTDSPVPPVPDEPGPGALRATESLPASDDTGHVSPAALGQAQQRAGAVPALPLGAVFDPESHEGPPPGRAEKDAAAARTLITGALLGELGRRLCEYENAITWGTSCLSCAATLDSSIRERERAERAERNLAAIRKRCEEAGTRTAGHILAILGTEGGTGDEH